MKLAAVPEVPFGMFPHEYEEFCPCQTSLTGLDSGTPSRTRSLTILEIHFPEVGPPAPTALRGTRGRHPGVSPTSPWPGWRTASAAQTRPDPETCTSSILFGSGDPVYHVNLI